MTPHGRGLLGCGVFWGYGELQGSSRLARQLLKLPTGVQNGHWGRLATCLGKAALGKGECS